ncbi:hypothetical protein BC938DRAFT_476371 [Jimgerdemannia flammicorona]|uniref:Uncharacterized protein n=1 Tax=Jimgerdemannia flammicorona TaxID=994334 RepID=A0A433PHT2_9FUNG|nr:hypothetical protein BC938DRAFT_476371 [Jimgerdemannia flammicorona]
MLATYHSSQTGPPTVTDILKSSQFDHPVKPLKSAAFSKGADLSDDFSKDLSLLSTPPTPAGVHDTNPLEREKAILYQQLLDVRAEVKDLEFHLEDLRGRKAKEGGKKKGGPPVVETDGLESVLYPSIGEWKRRGKSDDVCGVSVEADHNRENYLLQINNATFLASPPPAMEKSALAAPAKPAPPVAKETPQAEASEQVNVAKEVMSDVQVSLLCFREDLSLL